MKVLSDPEEYYKLQREARDKSGKQAFSNCYLTADVLAYHISKGNIQYFCMPDGVGFLIDRGTVYTFQFCLASTSGIELPLMEKPFVAELIYREGKISTAQQAAGRQLIQAGLRLHRELHEYVIGNISESEQEKNCELLQKLKKVGFRFQPVNIEYAREAYQILNAGIDPFDMRGFQDMNWQTLCGNRQAFCVMSPQGQMCAVCVLPRGFRGGLTVVAEPYRGMKLGRAITFYSYRKEGHLYPSERIWIEATNSVNQHITVSMGGKDTMRRSRQYIKE